VFFLVVFSTAAADESFALAQIAFAITERLLTQHFELLMFDFVELVNCLCCFAAGAHMKISLKGYSYDPCIFIQSSCMFGRLEYLQQCARHLAGGTVAPALEKSVGILPEVNSHVNMILPSRYYLVRAGTTHGSRNDAHARDTRRRQRISIMVASPIGAQVRNNTDFCTKIVFRELRCILSQHCECSEV
jgi:hypothetical protein